MKSGLIALAVAASILPGLAAAQPYPWPDGPRIPTAEGGRYGDPGRRPPTPPRCRLPCPPWYNADDDDGPPWPGPPPAARGDPRGYYRDYYPAPQYGYTYGSARGRGYGYSYGDGGGPYPYGSGW